jgi:hypothetical protein
MRFLDFARNDKRSSEVTPVEVGKNIIAPFAIGQESLINGSFSGEGVVQALEAFEMFDRSFGRVFAGGPVLDEKGPVAGLSEQEFPGQLPEQAISQRV